MHDRSAIHLSTVAALLSITILAAVLAVSPPPARAAGAGVLFGAYAQPRPGQDARTAVEALEAELGTTLPIIRSYSRFDTPLDNRFHRWAADGDRTVLASVSTQRADGRRLTWAQIADAPKGSEIHADMIALARSAERFDGDLWVIFNHEPEAWFNRSLGTSSDFVRAWRRLHGVFQAEGATGVPWVWTMTSWSFEVERHDPTDRRRADLWYPGDAYVDYLGADPYNWYGCRTGSPAAWESLEETTRPFLEWSRRHPTKRLVLPEWGSVEGNAGQKAAWIRDVGELMKRRDWAERFAAIVYFHDDHEDTEIGTDCTWWLDSSSSSLAAARTLAQDPYFRGGPTDPAIECAGLRATIIGTPDDDHLTGTAGRDVISGLGGDDRIDGLSGDDVICGGDGDDVLVGGDGVDRILGQDGRDVLRGGAAGDHLDGGRNRDRISGGRGDDTILGGAGNDSLSGGSGVDALSGGRGRDRCDRAGRTAKCETVALERRASSSPGRQPAAQG